MNFLSHYYFDRNAHSLKILGSLLPDLIKNAGHFKISNPLKQPDLFKESGVSEIYEGWKNHIMVDKYFHASDFFTSHTQKLKTVILPITLETEVRPSFLAHITLELILDHLIIINNQIKVDKLYIALQESDKKSLESFLSLCQIKETEQVLLFIQNFIASKYLISYQKVENIAYALNRICMRLWPAGMPKERILALEEIIDAYISTQSDALLSIFPAIEHHLASS